MKNKNAKPTAENSRKLRTLFAVGMIGLSSCSSVELSLADEPNYSYSEHSPSFETDVSRDEIEATFSTLSFEEKGPYLIELTGMDLETILPDWKIEFIEGNNPDNESQLGLTYTREQRIEVYVHEGSSAERNQHILAHELGHAVDITYNTDELRAEYLRIRNLSTDTTWWPGSGLSDFHTGAGDFAETFAQCHFDYSVESQSELGEGCDENDKVFMLSLLASATED